MKYGWFIRGKRSKLFVGVQGSVLRSFANAVDATMFPSAMAAQEVADSVVMAPDLEVVDMAIHAPLPQDEDQTPVPSLAEVIAAAKAADLPKEAQRRATWSLIQKAVVAIAIVVGTVYALASGPVTAAPLFPSTIGAHNAISRPDHRGRGSALRHTHYLRLRSSHAPRQVVVNEPFSFSGAASSAVAVASRYLGGNPTGHNSLWCADFANFVERQLGRAGTGSREALSFLHYGPRVVDPRPGDIVVLGRRGGGHVGFLIKQTAAGPEVISGNHGHRVGIGVYNPRSVIAYVRPS